MSSAEVSSAMKRHAGAEQIHRPGTTKHPQTSNPQTAGNTSPPSGTSLHTHTDRTGYISIYLRTILGGFCSSFSWIQKPSSGCGSLTMRVFFYRDGPISGRQRPLLHRRRAALHITYRGQQRHRQQVHSPPATLISLI